jgi:hypothetical protein
MNTVRLQALYRAPTQQLTMSVVKPGRTCSVRETGTEELCEIKWDYHTVGTMAECQFGTKLPQQ